MSILGVRRKPVSSILVLLLFVFSNASAQENMDDSLLLKNLKFYHYDTSNGLSNNMVSSIAQDKLGFIWIGTNSGLNRFDGREFERFNKENSGLIDNYIQQITPASNGNLYLATNGGIHTYHLNQNLIKQEPIRNSILSYSITSILELPDATRVVGDYSFGVHLIKNQRHLNLKIDGKAEKAFLADYRISALGMQNDSTILAGTYTEGLYRIRFKDTVAEAIEKLFEGRVNAIYPDSQNNVWIGTDEGLKLITRQEKIIHINKNNSALSDEVIRSIVEDDEGLLWIGTSNGGLNILDPESVFDKNIPIKIQRFLPRADGSSVHHRNIFALFKDNNGNIWIGTETGLDFVDPRGETIQLVSHSHGTQEYKISSDRVKALAPGKNDKIWIGTDGGGVDAYSTSAKKFLKTTIDLPSKLVLSLLEDSHDNLWIGTYRNGIFKYDLKKKEFHNYLETSVAEGSDVRTIFEDSSGNLWVGTNRGGLYLYEPEKDNFRYIEKLGKLDVREIIQKDAHEIWMATYGNGIINYNYRTGEFTDFHTANTSLPINIIFSIAFIDANTILAGTMNEGLLKLNIKNREVQRFSTKDGLSNNTVNSITRDNSGNYWIGTNEGISLYDSEQNEIKNLNNFSNLQKSEFNIGAGLLTKDGTLFIGGNKGLNIFETDDLSNPKKSIFPTVFKNLEIYGNPVSLSDSTQGVLDKAIFLTDTLRIKHDQALFSLDFAPLKFPNSGNIEYSYLLEGYSNHWVNIKNANRINFSQLPPGDYTLKLRTNGSDYLESANELFIQVIPPFWKTTPAYILYILTAIFLFWLGLKYYTEKIKLKQSLVFEKNQRQLEHELNEERLRFYTGFSHELKTPLTMILAPVETLLAEIRKKEHANSLRLIEKNAKTLLKRINKLLDFKQTEDGLNKLNINKHHLSKSLQKWLAMYDPIARKKGVKIIKKIQVKEAVVHCDLDKIHIAFNNLMSNALKYTSSGDEIKVKLKYKEGGFQISVKDNGAGIPPQILPHIFEWYYHSDAKLKKDGSGIGLALSKRFMELHNGKITAESIENRRTVFKMFLPKGTPVAMEHRRSFEVPDFEKVTANILNENKQLENRALLNPNTDRELILLIDDNPDIHHYLSSVLKEDYDLLHALNGREGINMAAKHVPDLIVSDIMMPEKSGIDLTSALKSRGETTHIPIILLSAKDTRESIVNGYNEGANDYITKPFSPAVLKARIKNLLKRKIKLQNNLLQPSEEEKSLNQEECKQVDIEKKFLQKFEKTVYDHIQMQGKMVELISEEMGMSRASLYRKIKALTGKSINEYIRDIKLEKSLRLIEKEGLNISTAAFEVGFNNMKYFRKIFKEKFGKLPSDCSLNKDLT